MNLFIGNLSPETTEDALRQAFTEFGVVLSVKIPIDNATGLPRGFGFVEMEDKFHALDAIDNLDTTYFQGTIISVKESKPKNQAGGNNRQGGGNRGGFNRGNNNRQGGGGFNRGNSGGYNDRGGDRNFNSNRGERSYNNDRSFNSNTERNYNSNNQGYNNNQNSNDDDKFNRL